MYSRPATEGPHVAEVVAQQVGGEGGRRKSRGSFTCVLVKLVLDFRAARNLDHRVHDVWCCVAQLQIMPAKGVVERLKMYWAASLTRTQTAELSVARSHQGWDAEFLTWRAIYAERQ